MCAATLWRRVLACELALAIALALGMQTLAHFGFWAVLPAAFGVFLLIQISLVAASMVVARALGGKRVRPAPAFATARALALETLHFACAQFAMSLQRRGRIAGAGCPAGPGPWRPVLLVHGLACNRGVWWVMRRRLRAAGFACVHDIDLEPLNADLDQLAGILHQEVSRLQREYPGEQLTILAHSMGGLVARAMQRLPGSSPIRHLITLATPHEGSELARVVNWPGTQQMRPGSAWLAQLNARGEHTTPRGAGPRTTCFYSANDNLVAPAASAALAGAVQFELFGLGHFGLLASRRVWRLLAGALREAT